eukprot:Sspe_Gene.41333::Locus_19992_Transcript_1_1_Confidence_1.000_Length_3096::g.41333::m.41333
MIQADNLTVNSIPSDDSELTTHKRRSSEKKKEVVASSPARHGPTVLVEREDSQKTDYRNQRWKSDSPKAPPRQQEAWNSARSPRVVGGHDTSTPFSTSAVVLTHRNSASSFHSPSTHVTPSFPFDHDCETHAGSTVHSTPRFQRSPGRPRVDSSRVETERPTLPPSVRHEGNGPQATDEAKQQQMRWKPGKYIGHGAVGRVYVGLNQDTGKLMAVKKITFDAKDQNVLKMLNDLQREVKILRQVAHPNIVGYKCTVRTGNTVNIFMEYVPGGSIQSLVKQFGPLSEPIVKLYTSQILAALEHLHDRGIVHRDVKGANVLVNTNGAVKVADFGTAMIIKDLKPKTTNGEGFGTCGTPFWMAPEVILNESYSFPCDIWSLGCTVIEMLTKEHPFAHITTSPMHYMHHIGSNKPITLHPMLDKAGESCIDFILSCLNRNPRERPLASQLLDHAFMPYDDDYDDDASSNEDPIWDAGAYNFSSIAFPKSSWYSDSNTVRRQSAHQDGLSPPCAPPLGHLSFDTASTAGTVILSERSYQPNIEVARLAQSDHHEEHGLTRAPSGGTLGSETAGSFGTPVLYGHVRFEADQSRPPQHSHMPFSNGTNSGCTTATSATLPQLQQHAAVPRLLPHPATGAGSSTSAPPPPLTGKDHASHPSSSFSSQLHPSSHSPTTTSIGDESRMDVMQTPPHSACDSAHSPRMRKRLPATLESVLQTNPPPPPPPPLPPGSRPEVSRRRRTKASKKRTRSEAPLHPASLAKSKLGQNSATSLSSNFSRDRTTRASRQASAGEIDTKPPDMQLQIQRHLRQSCLSLLDMDTIVVYAHNTDHSTADSDDTDECMHSKSSYTGSRGRLSRRSVATPAATVTGAINTPGTLIMGGSDGEMMTTDDFLVALARQIERGEEEDVISRIDCTDSDSQGSDRMDGIQDIAELEKGGHGLCGISQKVALRNGMIVVLLVTIVALLSVLLVKTMG